MTAFSGGVATNLKIAQPVDLLDYELQRNVLADEATAGKKPHPAAGCAGNRTLDRRDLEARSVRLRGERRSGDSEADEEQREASHANLQRSIGRRPLRRLDHEDVDRCTSWFET